MQQIAVHCSPRAIFDSWHLLGRGGAAIGGEWQGGWQRESFWQGSVSTVKKRNQSVLKKKKYHQPAAPWVGANYHCLRCHSSLGSSSPGGSGRKWQKMACATRGGGGGRNLAEGIADGQPPRPENTPLLCYSGEAGGIGLLGDLHFLPGSNCTHPPFRKPHPGTTTVPWAQQPGP